MWFTTSWDDGHPLDLRVAELLAKYGIRGTFYVPRRNIEGRSVLSATQLRALAGAFEIGGHTIDHVRLNAVSVDESRRQVAASKVALEDELGRPVAGFCYPGGVHTAAIREIVKAVGYRYARTIENFCVERPTDPFRLSTTLQLFPHRRTTYAKNLARGGNWRARARGFGIAVASPSFDRALDRLLDEVARRAGVFHLWGHSWELEEHGLWNVLDRFLERVAARVTAPRRVENAALFGDASG